MSFAQASNGCPSDAMYPPPSDSEDSSPSLGSPRLMSGLETKEKRNNSTEYVSTRFSPPAAPSLTGWRKLLELESRNSQVSIGSKHLTCNIALFDGQPAALLAKVSLKVPMVFGCSLQSRLRGLWHDSMMRIDFHIISDAAAPLGISIASSNEPGRYAAPTVLNVNGSKNVSPCLQYGALSAVIQRALAAAWTAWHHSFFSTAQQCRAATPLPQHAALHALERALDRPCSISKCDDETGFITTCGDDGFLLIAQNDLTDGTADFHVRITLCSGCVFAIDIDGLPLNLQRARALDDARLRLGLRDGPLPVSNCTAAAIVELIMTPLAHKNADATPNLFSYLAAHVALSLKNCLVSANSHTGEELARHSVMPFVPVTSDVSLFAIDNGMCGLSLQDALCCMPPSVLKIIFDSALAASKHTVVSRDQRAAHFDLCQPWPAFLLKEAVLNQDRSGIIGDATRRAGTDPAAAGSGQRDATAALHAGLGVQNKRLPEWQTSIAAGLRALECKLLIDLMAAAQAGSPTLEQRQRILQLFLSASGGSADQYQSADARRSHMDMVEQVCGYVLRTLPYFPVQVTVRHSTLLWFGDETPWEDGLNEDV